MANICPLPTLQGLTLPRQALTAAENHRAPLPSPGARRLQFSPEVRVPGGVGGHLDLDGTGVLQANDLGERGEGVVQPGGRGALQAQASLRGWPCPEVRPGAQRGSGRA